MREWIEAMRAATAYLDEHNAAMNRRLAELEARGPVLPIGVEGLRALVAAVRVAAVEAEAEGATRH